MITEGCQAFSGLINRVRTRVLLNLYIENSSTPAQKRGRRVVHELFTRREGATVVTRWRHQFHTVEG